MYCCRNCHSCGAVKINRSSCRLGFDFLACADNFVFAVHSFGEVRNFGKNAIYSEKTAVPTDYVNQSEFANLVGEIGVAVTPLRPSGKFMIDEKVYEGICETAEMIATGEYVKVVKVEGIKIIVEKTEV